MGFKSNQTADNHYQDMNATIARLEKSCHAGITTQWWFWSCSLLPHLAASNIMKARPQGGDFQGSWEPTSSFLQQIGTNVAKIHVKPDRT